MGEPALRYGDPVLLYRQLEHLLKLSKRPSVSIRVVPFSAGIHPSLTGAFAMATQAGRRPVGYLDDQLRSRVVADADDIGALEWTWEALSARALPIEQTRDMIGSLCNACTELNWRKSSRSGSNGGNCVEVADNLADRVLVRDSKDPSGPTLTFGPDAWRAFVHGLANR